ncbi:type II secretion system protein [Massilia niastensis]|uniref:type II secretion system protein n=1 Tax=Massilia niastensis TaxID=544911 RepID=UPI000364F114|nr:type II secretion system protein [Massilia niastensis]
MRAAGGFTVVEAMIALVVLAILLAVGVPNLTGWLSATKAAGATQFYTEAYAVARAQALSHNSLSRVVFTRNAGNGQLDWQVDICFEEAGLPCDPGSARWSTVDEIAEDDPEGETGFRSVRRSAAALPGTGVLTVTPAVNGASSVYFTALGWVDSARALPLTRLDLEPADGHDAGFQASSIVLTLAGVASRCKPDAEAGDSRRCPQ